MFDFFGAFLTTFLLLSVRVFGGAVGVVVLQKMRDWSEAPIGRDFALYG